LPVAPGGGSKSNAPVALLVTVTVPPAGLVAPVVPTVKLAVYPVSPVSGSVALASGSARLVFFMFACTTFAPGL
jgi:hypothetical protein